MYGRRVKVRILCRDLGQIFCFSTFEYQSFNIEIISSILSTGSEGADVLAPGSSGFKKSFYDSSRILDQLQNELDIAEKARKEKEEEARRVKKEAEEAIEQALRDKRKADQKVEEERTKAEKEKEELRKQAEKDKLRVIKEKEELKTRAKRAEDERRQAESAIEKQKINSKDRIIELQIKASKLEEQLNSK